MKEYPIGDKYIRFHVKDHQYLAEKENEIWVLKKMIALSTRRKEKVIPGKALKPTWRTVKSFNTIDALRAYVEGI